jgi:DNA-binding response OmpR family regulator
MSDRDLKSVSVKNPSTIMVVEPDILVRTVIADFLRECGYKVIEGMTAEDVFTVLRAGNVIHIVLADVGIQGELDGFRLARRLRESHPDIDVILTAGAARSADKATDLCGDGPLKKPFHPKEVIRRIQTLREKRGAMKSGAPLSSHSAVV